MTDDDLARTSRVPTALYVLAVAAIVGLVALAGVAKGSDQKPVIDPTVVGTAGLIVITAYYAWLNRQMAAAMAASAKLAGDQTKATQDSVDATRDADLARQREVQILEIKPFAIPEVFPTGRSGAWLAPFSFPLRGRTVLHLTVMVRGMGEAPLPPDESSDGWDAMPAGLGSWPGDSQVTPAVELPLTKFMSPTGRPYGAKWDVHLTYLGTLGQEVLERYEWRIENQLDGVDGLNWQLRRLVITFPTIPGAKLLDLPFGDD